MDSFFDRALAAARRLGASDVHLKPGQSPILRIAGELRTFTDVPALSREFLQSLALSPEVIVGHSAGAAIGARMCLDAAMRPDLLVSLNGALLPMPGVPVDVFAP